MTQITLYIDRKCLNRYIIKRGKHREELKFIKVCFPRKKDLLPCLNTYELIL